MILYVILYYIFVDSQPYYGIVESIPDADSGTPNHKNESRLICLPCLSIALGIKIAFYIAVSMIKLLVGNGVKSRSRW
jgi:hypothetical protein